MNSLLGTTVPVFIGVTLVLAGGAAYMTGQALASHWRPLWQVFVYIALLGLADRFMTFALFAGELFSPTGYLIDTAVLLAIGLFGYRLTRARQMVRQYPWLYQPDGLLGWREKKKS
ncbi:MAG: hypothetical protein MJE77_10735 [Proteobacteria bacterium]|nr:hypothetical protein [Pseudomonadota bacterium]